MHHTKKMTTNERTDERTNLVTSSLLEFIIAANNFNECETFKNTSDLLIKKDIYLKQP